MTAPVTEHSRLERWTWPVIAAIVAITIGVLRWEGRRWWCACGQLWPWASDVWSSHCSQHLFDPYSFTHVSHGLICCGFLALVFPRWSVSRGLCATVLFASGWEMLENSAFIIERYRHETMSLHYLGDSVANSLGDILSCVIGFAIARCLGWRYAIALFVVMEVMLLILIRDNLTINVLMLIHPIPAIKAWQVGGA